MNDILLKNRRNRIECKINGAELTYTDSRDPRFHTVVMLRDENLYEDLKREINEIYEDHIDKDYGYDVACEFLETKSCHRKYFVKDSAYGYFDLRDREEIHEYLDEAFDKVWLIRNCVISRRIPKHEVGRHAMNRILDSYDDIPKNGYDNWECGYWNGIMGALRWVLGDEKDFLDT